MVTRRIALGHADFGTRHSAVSVRPAPHSQSGRNASEAARRARAVFLRLGLTAFGGPAAHIAMMEDEAVVRRQWLTRERFLDLLGVTNLLPGPSSSELAIYLGYVRAGWPGLVVGGCLLHRAGGVAGHRPRLDVRALRLAARDRRACSTASGRSWWRSSFRRSGDSARRPIRARPRWWSASPQSR